MTTTPQIRILPIDLLSLSIMGAAQKQQAADGKTPDAGARNFLADLLAGKCSCARCVAKERSTYERTASTEAPAGASSASSTSASQPERAGEQNSTGSQVTSSPQEEVRASGGISETACRAVNFTDADTGEAAQVKGAAAALITGLEDLRDSLPGGAADRITAEGHIGGIARACAWAVSLQRSQPA